MRRARTLGAAFAVPLLLWCVADAEALPRFSVREGAPCAMCHVDPSGGGMRNDYGRGVYSATRLPAAIAVLPDGAEALDPRIGAGLALGADVRVLYHHLRKHQAARPRMDSFYVMEAAPYLSADLWRYVTLYVAQVLHGSESVFFEAFGLVRAPAGGLYLKVGRFTPPFGFKLADHSAFVRKRQGFSVRRKTTGLELGSVYGPLSAQLAVFNGISEEADSDWDDNSAKGLSARLSYRLGGRTAKVQAGLSAYYNRSGLGPSGDTRPVDARVEEASLGAFGGLSLGRFAYMGEVDYRRRDDRREDAAVGQLFGHQELAFLALRGLDVVAVYEFWDGDVEVKGDAVHRLAFGVDIYAWPFTEVSVRMRSTIADDRHPMADLREMIAVTHFFF